MNINNHKNFFHTHLSAQAENEELTAIKQQIVDAIRAQTCQYIGQKLSKQTEVIIANNIQTMLANLDYVYSCKVLDNIEVTCESDTNDGSKVNISFQPKSTLGKLIIRDLQQSNLEELNVTCISKFNFILGD